MPKLHAQPLFKLPGAAGAGKTVPAAVVVAAVVVVAVVVVVSVVVLLKQGMPAVTTLQLVRKRKLTSRGLSRYKILF